MLVSVLAHASTVEYAKIEPILDRYQGEAVCVDLLETMYGETAVVVDVNNTYSIPNVCDFE